MSAALRSSSIAASLLLLLACGGGDGSSPTEPSPPDDPLAGDLTPDNAEERYDRMRADFRRMYDLYVLYTGLHTDEFIAAGDEGDRIEVDDRQPISANQLVFDDVWAPMSASRAVSDEVVEEFEGALGDPEFSDLTEELQLGIALGQLYGGYARIFFAELFCQSIFGGGPVEVPPFVDEVPESAPFSSVARMSEAVALLEQAQATAADAGGLDLIVWAAQVGEARAHMFLGSATGDAFHFGDAEAAVSGVPTGLVLVVEYPADPPEDQNSVYRLTWGEAAELRWTVGAGDDDTHDNERFLYFDGWIDQGLVIPQSVSESASGADKSAFDGSTPVRLQTLYGGHDGKLSDVNIPLATGWEARMIEAEHLLRNGSPSVAQDIVNVLLLDPAPNPMLAVNGDLADPDGFVTEGLDAFPTVSFGDEPLQGDLAELARGYESGLWLTGHRQAVLVRFAREFSDRSALGLWPDRSGVNSITLPVPREVVDSNENIAGACPSGLP